LTRLSIHERDAVMRSSLCDLCPPAIPYVFET